MKVLLDTNFILTSVREGIDFVSLAEELFDESIEWIVPQQVLNELGLIKDRVGGSVKDRDAANTAFQVLQKIEPQPTIVQLSKHPNVDMAIINYILDKPIVLATMDKDLKGRVNNSVLSLRGKKKLELI